MNDFAKRLAGEIRNAESVRAEEREQKNTESAAFVQREKLKQKLGPALWQQLREEITRKCADVNKELGREHYRVHDELPAKLRVIRVNPPANLRLEFHADGSRIHYDGGSCVGDYLIQIEPGTGQAYLSDPYQRTFELESTSEYLLQECLEKAQF